MDSLSKLAQSLALIRAQAGRKGTAASAPLGEKAPVRAQAVRSTRGNNGRGDLRERIVSSLAALSEAELASGERPVMVFVEQVLLHEWGPGFRESARFRQTVKRVARTMRNAPPVRSELDALLQDLRPKSRA